MAITFVQDDHLVSTAVTSQPIAFGSNVTAGGFLVAVCGASNGSTVTGITDTLTNTWAQVATNNDGNVLLEIWAAQSPSGGANTVTIGWSGSNNPQSYILEYAGVATSSATDQTGNNDESATTAHNCNGSNLTPSQDNCLVIGCGRFQGSITVTAQETGYTTRTGSAGGPASRVHVHDSIQTTATATDADFTTGANASGTLLMAIFKPLVAAGGVAPRAYYNLLQQEG